MDISAQDKLKKKIDSGLHICVGLDSDIIKIPEYLKNNQYPIFDFNKIIIEATYTQAAAYKLNFAFYESWGIEGIELLKKTIEFIPEDILIIGDAKRGDIGNTSKKYAESVFDYFKCDAITLHPYMGYDSIKPFLEYEDKISFILGLTSNMSSVDFEKLPLQNGKLLYQAIIEKTNDWNTKNNCGLVFGATNVAELQINIESFNSMPILLPGVGAQGGSLEDVVKSFLIVNKSNYLINVSRSLIYCDNSELFPESIHNNILNYNKIIQELSVK